MATIYLPNQEIIENNGTASFIADVYQRGHRFLTMKKPYGRKIRVYRRKGDPKWYTSKEGMVSLDHSKEKEERRKKRCHITSTNMTPSTQ